ncbi:hypothetical protein BDQ17DRAFT_1207949, partial [Cyathus striatus]
DCDVYLIAIVMCPDRKLKWFKDNGCKPSEIRDIKTAVIDCWKKKYVPDGEGEEIEPETPQIQLSKYSLPGIEPPPVVDSIEGYLTDPLVPTSSIVNVGGYMKYW